MHIADNVHHTMERIRKAAEDAGRPPEEVRLVAVSKTIPLDAISKAVRAGVTILGENYLQEAQQKVLEFDEPVSWHFIGHLQSKKAKHVVPLFDLIHSVDSLKLAREIDRQAGMLDTIKDILIQVNVSGEASKFGISPMELEPLLGQIQSLEHIRVRGLMTMPPFFDQPERVRPFFADLRRLMDSMKSKAWSDSIQLDELSMGMSGDFEAAIMEGATLVRVGTSIFGPRN